MDFDGASIHVLGNRLPSAESRYIGIFEPNQVVDDFNTLCTELGDDYRMVLDYMEDSFSGQLRERSLFVPTSPNHFWNISALAKNNMHRTKYGIEN